MANKDERNLNIIINSAEEDDRPVISISTLLKKMRRNFMLWLVAAVVFVVAAFGYAGFTTHVKKAKLEALVSFSYDGVEKGLDPSGRKFDVTTIKNPAVIESALTELNLSLEELENIRKGIDFIGTMPKDAVERLKVYESVLLQGNNGSMSAAEKILETTYFPTQYTVTFDYNETGLTDSEAVDVFNEILNNYKDYFYMTYGYNESLGNAVSTINYSDYDYTEAIDVFDNSLLSLKRYVKELANEDDTRFRSASTGYTFDDLYEAINTVETIDLDKISSYITVNNLTKDKDEALAYYEYRIKSLSRQKAQLEEQLQTYEDSIAAYEKDQIIVFGGGEEANTQSSLASAQYDKMFGEKNNTASELARVKQQINDYKDRQQSLKSGAVGSKAMLQKVDENLSALNDKISNLVELVCDTSEEYYKDVTFKNAYNVLVPATNTSSDRMARIINNAKMPLVLLEFLGFAVFFAVSFVQAITADSRKRKAQLAAVNDDTSAAGGDDADDESESETDNEAENEVKSEEKKPVNKKRK